MNKEIIKRIKEIFAEKIATKNSWGKNEIINLHNEAVSEALMEFV